LRAGKARTCKGKPGPLANGNALVYKLIEKYT
jgi:hypothetical protein